jgi:hypothetical protein
MKSNASNALYGSILILVFILIACLFTWTQQRVLKAVQPQNRLMRPGKVWLQLIPIFGFFWQFVVVLRIAKSVNKDRLLFHEDSILGLSEEDAGKISENPSLPIGITYCFFCVVLVPIYFLPPNTVQAGVRFFLIFGTMTCWIIYWTQIVILGRRLRGRMSRRNP